MSDKANEFHLTKTKYNSTKIREYKVSSNLHTNDNGTFGIFQELG